MIAQRRNDPQQLRVRRAVNAHVQRGQERGPQGGPQQHRGSVRAGLLKKLTLEA